MKRDTSSTVRQIKGDFFEIATQTISKRWRRKRKEHSRQEKWHGHSSCGRREDADMKGWREGSSWSRQRGCGSMLKVYGK